MYSQAYIFDGLSSVGSTCSWGQTVFVEKSGGEQVSDIGTGGPAMSFILGSLKWKQVELGDQLWYWYT